MSRTVNLGKIVPERGTDYWTAQDKAEIISTATTNVENNFASTIATIQSNSSNALNTANTANNTANTAKSIAEGANQALSYTNYQAMITAFNELADNVYKVGQNIMIITLNVPDLWISAIENTSITYNYTNDEAITTALSTNGYIQVGYYKLSALETQKVDLTDYYTKTGTENKIEDYLYQIMPTDSASGTIATINDSTTMFNAIDITGTIEPVQDLHGYDNPWPAGGGLNKIPLFESKTVNGVTLTNNNGEITLNGTATADAYFDVDVNISVPNGSTLYLCCFNPVATDSRVSLFLISDNGNPQSNMNVANKMTTTTTTADMTISKFKLCAPIGVTLTSFKCSPMLQIGGTAPTVFSPYSNICPITGWTGTNVSRTGVNVWDEEWEVGGLDDNGEPNYDTKRIRTKNYIFVKPNTTYSFFNRLKLFEYNANKEYVGNTDFIGVNTTAPKASTFTTGSNTYYLKFVTTTSYPTTYGNDLFMNYPSTDTTYHPYSGTTYPISWQSEAGTVYGGNLDVTTGVLTVDRAVSVFDGSSDELWTYYAITAGNLFRLQNYSTMKPTADIIPAISNAFKPVAQQFRTTGTISSGVGGTNVDFVFDGANSLAEWKEWLAENNVQLCYELATPVTYQLTPQEVSFLLGTNNLWVDTGDINVTYKADIQKYIDKKTN